MPGRLVGRAAEAGRDALRARLSAFCSVLHAYATLGLTLPARPPLGPPAAREYPPTVLATQGQRNLNRMLTARKRTAQVAESDNSDS